jgi:hypothetical protein
MITHSAALHHLVGHRIDSCVVAGRRKTISLSASEKCDKKRDKNSPVVGEVDVIDRSTRKGINKFRVFQHCPEILNTAVPTIAAALHVAPLNMKSVLASYIP